MNKYEIFVVDYNPERKGFFTLVQKANTIERAIALVIKKFEKDGTYRTRWILGPSCRQIG